ncbi:MAG TPA: DUF4873 domain-containing protein [Dehalococcoidia bacterium]|nr:DUF4873 domain-containing protein [Dehalococcoidia bacterium]
MSDYEGPAVIRKYDQSFNANVKLWRTPPADGPVTWGGEVMIPGHPDPLLLTGGEFEIEIPDAREGLILIEKNIGWQRRTGTGFVVSGSGDPPFGDPVSP